MTILHYRVVKLPSTYKAICLELPHLTWTAETIEKAIWGAQESVFRYLLKNGYQFGIAKAIW